MFALQAMLFCFLVLLLSHSPTEAYPQCINGQLPFNVETDNSFCPEYSNFGCCSAAEGQKLNASYEDLGKILPEHMWLKCSPYIRAFFCQTCSPYASRIYLPKHDDPTHTFYRRIFPGFCSDYCHTFHNLCGEIIPFYIDYMQQASTQLDFDANVLRAAFKGSPEDFCQVASLVDPEYCFPTVLEDKDPQSETISSDDCLCVQKVGDRDISDVFILTHANDDSNRMFVVDGTGLGYIMYPDGDFLPEPFFDITGRIAPSAGQLRKEPVVLGMAFHPAFKDNGLFYLYFTKSQAAGAGKRRNTLGEFKVLDSDKNKADMEYFRHILDVTQDSNSHHGGQILFGTDGFLYIFTGDGIQNGRSFRSQNMQRLVGKVLRIDVDNPTETSPYSIPEDNPFLDILPDGYYPRPEIYAYGLRNPWKCGIDLGNPDTGAGKGRMMCGDIGHRGFQEIDLIEKGANYGWPNVDGSHKYCDTCRQGIRSYPQTYPVFEYNRTLGESVIGGHFYRGCSLSNMDGAFLYGDFGSKKLFRLMETSPGVWENKEIRMCGTDLCHGSYTNHYAQHIYSFGQDQQGEVYLLASNHIVPSGSVGYIFKLVDPRATNCGPKTPEETKPSDNEKPTDPVSTIHSDLISKILLPELSKERQEQDIELIATNEGSQDPETTASGAATTNEQDSNPPAPLVTTSQQGQGESAAPSANTQTSNDPPAVSNPTQESGIIEPKPTNEQPSDTEVAEPTNEQPSETGETEPTNEQPKETGVAKPDKKAKALKELLRHVGERLRGAQTPFVSLGELLTPNNVADKPKAENVKDNPKTEKAKPKVAGRNNDDSFGGSDEEDDSENDDEDENRELEDEDKAPRRLFFSRLG